MDLDTKNKIVELYEAKTSIASICEKFGCSSLEIKQIIYDEKLPFNNRQDKFLEEGLKFYEWTLIKKYTQDNIEIGWDCLCSCGTKKFIKTIHTVKVGTSSSCGCVRSQLLKTNNPMFNQEIRDKVSNSISLEHRQKIMAHASQTAWTDESRAKRVSTNIDKYGVAYPATSEQVKSKILKTVQERYGGNAPAQNPNVVKKGKDTSYKRYGVSNWMKLSENADYISKKLVIKKRESALRLSTGETLVDYCRANKILPTSARLVYYKYGQTVMEQWLKRELLGGSALEDYTYLLLKNNGINVEYWNKQVPKLVQKDFKYKPDLKIEMNNKIIYLDVDGLYYHSDVYKEKMYHFVKSDAFIECGLEYIQIRQDEFYGDKKDIVVSLIKNKLGLNTKIYARKTIFKEVGYLEAIEFLKKNHLMGKPAQCNYIGLYQEDRLLMLMGFSIKNKQLEIVRVATLSGVTVVGGLSKLLSKLDITNIDDIISFVDRRYANGNSYKNIGFECKGNTLGWHWTDKHVTYNRRAFRANPDTGETEAEVAKKAGVVKIYDAGQLKFVKSLKACLPSLKI